MGQETVHDDSCALLFFSSAFQFHIGSIKTVKDFEFMVNDHRFNTQGALSELPMPI